MEFKRCLGCMEESELDICPHCGYAKGTQPKEIYHMIPGSILNNKYIIGRVLGYGGFGITYIGWDIALGRKVAIKEFLPSEFSTRMPGETMVTVYNGEATVQFNAGLERFIEEAQRLAKFNQVGSVVDVYDTFIENNTGYIVMECLEGETVKELLKVNGVMPYESAKLIIVEILKTLSVVHKEGIIHRDIAPDNIFITNDNRIKLLDFGAARYASTFHSKSLSVILKPGYAPEEQYRSRGNQGPWSDVYATAATFYKMITGVTIEESMERCVKDNVKTPIELGINITEAQSNAIMNALNIHAEMRTQSAEAFIEELTANDVVRVVDNPYKSDVGKVPTWLKIAGIAVLSLAIIFGGLVMGGVIEIAGIGGPGVKADDETKVPEVINKMKDEGEQILSKSGFAMMISDQSYDEFAVKDIIKSQTPFSGKIAKVCETYDDKGRPVVYVVVSGGHAPVMVPSVMGIMKGEAEAILKKLGFEVKYEQEYSQTEPVDKVLLQDIVNTEYAYGSPIILTISKGVMKVDPSVKHKVPSLVGMSYAEASKKLTAIGMYSNVVQEASTAKEGQVIRQSVAASSEMPEGTTVTIYVSKNTIVIPDVTYKTEAVARSMITEAGANVSVKYEQNRNVKAGNVIRQSVTGKSTVGANVVITVSTGYTDEKPVSAPPTPAPAPTPSPAPAPTPTPAPAPTPAAPPKEEVHMITIPSVVGYSEASAKNTIVSRGGQIGTVTKQESSTVAAGNVISQSFTGSCQPATIINLVVSSGKKGASAGSAVVIPAEIIGMYVGPDGQIAYNEIITRFPELKGIKMGIEFISGGRSGTVVKTSPAAPCVTNSLKVYIGK